MNKLIKECFVCIKKTFKRFISILVIVLLGVGFYSGIKATSPDMQNTLNNYYQQTNFYDLKVMSNYGVDNNIIDKLTKKGYIVEKSYSFDAIVKKKEEYAIKVLSYSKSDKINLLIIKEGNLPTKENECVIEKSDTTKSYKIGDKILVENENLKEQELTITGFVESPLYISRERDTTKLLSGKINFNLYMLEDNFTNKAITNLYIDLNLEDSVFSNTYKKKVKEEKSKIKKLLSSESVSTYDDIKSNLTSAFEFASLEYENKLEKANSLLESSYISLNQKEQIRNDLKSAKDSLDTLNEEITSLEKLSWYVLDIESDIGYYQYEKDTERITNIAKLFPLVFFIVAILICLTTMTRMVEEERVQIGTLKSLGYSNSSIMFKYVLYALLATIIGSLVGVIIGFAIIPKVIFNMYAMMYTIGEFKSGFYISLTIQGGVIAILCTLGATLYTCVKTLKEPPAELLLPKAPTAGKRVLLEKITVIWKHLSFSRKVTIRNVFRYKKRFLMTIIGISGCTGLILAGFGLKDCITQMVPNQYEKIFKYEVSITLKDNVTKEEKEKDYQDITNLKEVKKSLKIHEESVEMDKPKSNQSIILMVPFGDIKDFITLQDRKTKEKYNLNDDVIITEKLAKLLKINKKDTITFTGEDKYKAKVSNITENYLSHYIYLNEKAYQGDSYNTIFIKTKKMTAKEEKEFSKKIQEYNSVSSLSFSSATRNIFDSTMQNFGYVSLVLIVSAGLLALVVLYNLSSVNISERKRELASLKVLGFYDREVYNYVSRESMILTIIGMILGLGLGNILTGFIIKTCELDMIMFGTNISILSYIYSLIITIVFTFIVNIIVYFSLKKIDMISSLKSVE